MSDTRDIKVHGTAEPTDKVSWLKEVKLDAARNVVRNLKGQAEQREYEEAKVNGLTVQDIVESGKSDLQDKGFLDTHNEFNDEAGFDYTEEQATDSDADKNGRTNTRGRGRAKKEEDK